MFSQFKDSQTAEAVDEYGIWAKWTRLALKIEKPLSSQAVYVVWQQSHA